jgi:hypothetical protein
MPSRMEVSRGSFEGSGKIHAHLESLLELIFYIKLSNFTGEAHTEAPTGVALNHIDGLYIDEHSVSR